MDWGNVFKTTSDRKEFAADTQLQQAHVQSGEQSSWLPSVVQFLACEINALPSPSVTFFSAQGSMLCANKITVIIKAKNFIDREGKACAFNYKCKKLRQ